MVEKSTSLRAMAAHVERVRGAIASLIGADSLLPEGGGRFLVTSSQDPVFGSWAQGAQPLLGTNALRNSLSAHHGFQRMLAEQRARVRAAVAAIGEFEEAAIVRHGSDSRWKIICRDASSPGKWRTQSFDLKGFSGHMTFDLREQAVQDAATSGFSVRDDDALDRIQDTPAFQRGLFAAELIRKVNAGETSFLLANEELAEYDRSQQVLASVTARFAQAYYEPVSDTMVFLADRIAPGREQAVFLHEVLHKHGMAALGKGVWERLTGQVLSWARAPVGELERTIHDAAFARASAALGPGADRHTFQEELLAYAVEEAVCRGVRPQARAEIGSAANWLAQVVATLRNLVRRLSGDDQAARQIGIQEAVDLAYALAQLENPARASEIRRALGPELAQRLGDAFSPRHWDEFTNAARLSALATQEMSALKAVAEFAPEGDADVAQARAQCAAVVAQHLGRPSWMMAPNGKPTKLSSTQWVMVRTDNFKRWFGNWEDSQAGASCVIDIETLEPLVVYHGSPKGGFSEFDPSNHASRGTEASFFCADPCVAATYSGSLQEVDVEDPDEFGDIEHSPGIYPVFLNIRRPHFEYFEGAAWNGERYDQWQLLDENAEPIEVDGICIFDRAQAESLALKHPDHVLEPAPDHWGSTNDAASKARKFKCDGAILHDVIDEGRHGGGYYDPADVYLVFCGRQVKSATLNVGTFDNGWDIRYSEQPQTGRALTATVYTGKSIGTPLVGALCPVSRKTLSALWVGSTMAMAEQFQDGEILKLQVDLKNPLVVDNETRQRLYGTKSHALIVEEAFASVQAGQQVWDGVVFADTVDGMEVGDVYAVFPRDGSVEHAVRVLERFCYNEELQAWTATGPYPGQSTFNAVRDVKFSFAGQAAMTADQSRLQEARRRIDAGDDAEMIRKETGWNCGVDGKWRFEISDAQAQLKMGDLSWGEAEDLKRGNSTGLLLGRLLEHPPLFAAYPSLQDVWVRLIPGMQGASFSQSENTITIGYDQKSGLADLRGLLHEMQHGIQSIEGFAAGGSPETAALPQIRQINEKLSWIVKEKDAIKEMQYAPGVDPQRVKTQLLALDAFYREQLNERANIDGYRAYQRLAGEVEARNTQARQALTDDERRDIAPSATADVPDHEVVVTFYEPASVMASASSVTGAYLPERDLQILLDEADGDMREVDMRVRTQCLMRTFVDFAAEHQVHAAMQPWAPMGAVTGVELTDLYAEHPGAGQGSVVMQHLTTTAQSLGVAIYLRPACSRSREFYARSGFSSVSGRSSAGMSGFVAWFPSVEDDEIERESGIPRPRSPMHDVRV